MDEGIDDGNLKIYKGYVSIKETTEMGRLGRPLLGHSSELQPMLIQKTRPDTSGPKHGELAVEERGRDKSFTASPDLIAPCFQTA